MGEQLQAPSQEVTDRFPLLVSSEEPDVNGQFQEFQRAGGLANVSIQRDRNDRIRYNRWRGRTSDYRKHRRALKQDPIPWEDAWDGRVYFADNIIEDIGDVLSSAFSRAQFKARPSEVNDVVKAKLVESILLKYRERMRPEIDDEAEYLWQFGLSHGGSVWHVGWERCIAMKMTPINIDSLLAAAQQAHAVMLQMPPAEIPQEIQQRLAQLAALGPLILDVQREKEAIQVLQMFARDIAAQAYSGQRQRYGDDFLLNYTLGSSVARQIVRDLREKGTAEIPGPYLSKNQPFACARELGYDYFCPPEMTDIQSASWHAVREWLTPEQLMEKRATDGWDADWVDEAIKTAGMVSSWVDSTSIGDSQEWQADDEIDAYDWQLANQRNGLIEVVHFKKRYISEEGIPEIRCTVWSPIVLNRNGPRDETTAPKLGGGTFPLYATHYRDEDLPNLYPFVAYRWQKKKRSFIHCVGVPQIVGSDQHSIKTSLDMLVDRQEMEVNPPWLVKTRMGVRYKAGPGSQIDYKHTGDIGRVNLEAGNPELAFKLVDSAMKRASEYFGLVNEHTLPAKWQSKLQRMTEKYLTSCAGMWTLVLRLIQKNADQDELARIAGADPQMPVTPEDIAGEYDVSLYFDVRDLDMDFAFKKLDAIAKMAVPLDRDASIDMSALTNLIVTTIDPTYATAILPGKGPAQQRLFKDTREQLSLVMQGNLPDLVQDDATAGNKLQIIGQLVQTNPIYQQALQNPHVRSTFEVWMKNLQQSVVQQQNAQTGRFGVDVGAAVAQQQTP